jgi:hypothetical protein
MNPELNDGKVGLEPKMTELSSAALGPEPRSALTIRTSPLRSTPATAIWSINGGV